MAASPYATSVAIILGGGLIGLGVYFGLRDRGREPAPPPAVTRAASPSAERAVPLPAPARAAAVPRDRVAKQVSDALEAQRGALADACWKPHTTDAPPPKPARWSFNFTIGADGVQLARGVAEQRGTGSPEITRCVLESLGPIAIPPPGASVAIDAPFGLP